MNVASKELCQELYELSRWDETFLKWYKFVGYDFGLYSEPLVSSKSDNYRQKEGTYICPAYDLGYLVRKFIGKGGVELRYGDKGCVASSHIWSVEADTPEDAIAKLAIRLFKDGVFDGLYYVESGGNVRSETCCNQ